MFPKPRSSCGGLTAPSPAPIYIASLPFRRERSCYDEGKRVSETLSMDYHREHGLDIRIVRIFNTYGPNMSLDDGRVVSNFVAQALRGEPLTVYGDGSQTRSFQVRMRHCLGGGCSASRCGCVIAWGGSRNASRCGCVTSSSPPASCST